MSATAVTRGAALAGAADRARDTVSARATENRRFPGFDGLRFIAAAAVVFSHAYLLATGSDEREPFVRLLGPGNIAGLYAVFTFFIVSGFLLSRSLHTNPNVPAFVVNRALRIYPGFAFCTLVTACLIGPLCTSLALRQYFASPDVLAFIRAGLVTIFEAPLPGVFAYGGNKLSTVVNGSLWSLHYEILSYVFLLVTWYVVPAGATGRLTVIAVMTAILLWLFPSTRLLSGIAYTLPYFAAGVAMHWVHLRHRTRTSVALLAAALLVLSGVIGIQAYAFAPLGAYLVVFVGERPNLFSKLADRIGDCSYGLYLYGWPAEQIVKQMTGTTSPMFMFALALPLALVFGLASYHLVEAPAMSQRKRLVTMLTRLIESLLRFAGDARNTAVVAGRCAFLASAAALLTLFAWGDIVRDMLLSFLFVTACILAVGLVRHARKFTV